jgi:hypothetical protein
MIYNIKRLLVFLLFSSISLVSFGDDPVPDPPPCPTGGGIVGEGAPIEDGVPIIMGLALIYGAFKLQQTRRKLKEMEKKV